MSPLITISFIWDNNKISKYNQILNLRMSMILYNYCKLYQTIIILCIRWFWFLSESDHDFEYLDDHVY